MAETAPEPPMRRRLGELNTKGLSPAWSAEFFKEPAKGAKSMRKQRGKDEWEKGDSQTKCTYFTLEGKADTHSDPCPQTDWSGVIRAPGLVGVGQESERECRDKTKLGQRPDNRVDLVRPGVEHSEVHGKVDRVGDDEKAKQTNALEYFAVAALPRSQDIFPISHNLHLARIIAARSGPAKMPRGTLNR